MSEVKIGNAAATIQKKYDLCIFLLVIIFLFKFILAILNRRQMVEKPNFPNGFWTK